MDLIMNIPVLVTMSGLLAWLFVLRLAQKATAVAPAYAFNFPGNPEFPGK